MRLPSYQDLSKEQDKALNLPLDGNYLIGGPPGTGKTVIAIYRAKTLADSGAQPRLLMYGRLLSQYTSDATEHLDVDAYVDTFHRWFGCYYFANYFETPPEIEKFKYDWSEILRQMVSSPPNNGHTSHIIVDEGQDLPKEFYSVLRAFVGNNVTIVADENQRITEENSLFKDLKAYGNIDEKSIYILKRNYRNTREIAQLAGCFYVGTPTGIAELPERSGPLPRVIQCRTPVDEVNLIHNYAKNQADKIIGVLVPWFNQQSYLLNALRNRRREDGLNQADVQKSVQMYSSKAREEKIDVAQPGIKIINYQSAKGLEFDAVFMPFLDQTTLDPEQDEMCMKLYVLISRAREALFFTYCGNGEPGFLRRAPQEFITRRSLVGS